LLPTCFNTKKQQGLIFTGSDGRQVEFSGFAIASLRRERNQFSFGGGRLRHSSSNVGVECFVRGNVPFQSNINFYYEIHIIKNESGTPVSIGFFPEGKLHFGENCYTYQSTGVKNYFTAGAKKSENYGKPYQVDCIIGCGWNTDTKIIFFTLDGEDLNTAFSNVNFGGDKIVPAVGIGKGVRVKVNFGQEQFIYNILNKSQISQQEKEKIINESNAKRQKEFEAEQARRKKQKADEEASRKEAAQPLVQMGYSLHKALKALEVTGYNGAEVAVIWLLENEGNIEENENDYDDIDDEDVAPPENSFPEIKIQKNEENIELMSKKAKSKILRFFQ